MWRGRDTAGRGGARWGGAACAVCAGTLLGSVAGSAWGQPVEVEVADEAVVGVTAADGLLAYELVQGWVRRGSVEAMEADPVGSMRRSGVVGARVVLRLDGRLMGVGEALVVRRGAGGEARGTDIVGLLRTATEDAMDGARRRLDEASARASAEAGARVAEGRAADGALSGDGVLLPWLKWADVADRLTASIEVGHDAFRLRASAGASASGWVAGRMGLRSVAGEGRLADVRVVWPAWSLASNLGAARQWASATGEALGQERRVEAFSVVHVARPVLSGGARVYDRGLPADMVAGAASTQRAREAGQRLTTYLLRRVTTDGLVGGDAEPSDETAVARPLDGLSRAAALAALTEARRMGWVNRGDWARVEAAMRRTARDLEGGVAVGLGEAGMLLVALADPAWSAAWADAERARLEGVVGEMLDSAERLRLTEAAIGLAGLAAAAERRGADADEMGALRSRIGELEAGAWRGVDVDVTAAWWLARAWDRLDAGGAGAGADRSAATAAATELLRRQVVTLDATRRWQVGGLGLGRGLAASEPDWRTAAGMGWMAVAARSAEGGDRVALLVGVAQAAGFVERLQLTEPRLWYGADVLAALGGVRASLVDNRLRLGPNALVLLALVDVVETTGSAGVLGSP